MNFRSNTIYQNSKSNSKYYDANNLNNNTQEVIQKKNITYDDILNSMNVRVENGVLKFAIDKNNLQQSNKKDENIINTKEYQNQQQIYSQNVNDTRNIKEVKITQPVEPEIKNSWIYNKYFKDYKDQNIEPERKIPKTKQEYKEMVVRNYLDKLNAIKNANQSKGKNLLFSNNNTKIQEPIQINNNKLNKLFKF